MSSSKSRSSHPHSHPSSISDVSSLSTSTTYGQVIERPFRLPSYTASNPSEGSIKPTLMSHSHPSSSSRPHSSLKSNTKPQTRSSSNSESRPSTTVGPFDSLRDQVAHTIVIRAAHKAQTVDGTKVGVILTLPHDAGEEFLNLVASRLQTVPKIDRYLFILALPTPTQGLSPLLVCSSDEKLSERAGMLVIAKFMNRIDRHELRHGRWGALVRDLCTTNYDEVALWDAVRKAAREPIDPLTPPPGSRSISQVLERARARLERLTPEQAWHELHDNVMPWAVVLVDIRPEAQRKACGSITGALVVERNVLEWRFDPRCAARLPIADRYDLRIIIFCQEGYTSSLAAASLHELGMLHATDIIGGYAAWKNAGLPDEVEVSSTAPPTEGRASVPIEE